MSGKEGGMKLHCFFCGGALSAGETPREFSCPGCRALFQAEVDESGCVVEMKVRGCGTPDCCRRRE